jgi:hypothetical protein
LGIAGLKPPMTSASSLQLVELETADEGQKHLLGVAKRA